MKQKEILLCLLFLWGCISPFVSIQNEMKESTISGIITKKVDTTPCFGYITINNIDTLHICKCHPQDLWNNIRIGDSLHKISGILEIELFPLKGDKSTWGYPYCLY